jgi:SAM-dependent methyltransferase
VSFEDIKERVVAYQERCFAAAGDSAKGVDWKGPEAQYLLFEVIESMGILPDSSVLDVGCGLAHLYDFLTSRGFRGKYTGVDISPALVAQARARLPHADVRVADVLDGAAPVESHDFVVASGVFTARLGTPVAEYEDYVEKMIRRMWELARAGAVFNMLTSYVDFEAEHLYYADPGKYLSLAKSMSRYVALRHDFPGFFFAVGMYRSARGAGG